MSNATPGHPGTASGTASGHPSIPQLVEARAVEHPDRIAVAGTGEQLSYAEVVRRVRSLAATLRERHGVRRGVFVPLLLQRNTDMAVAILAVMSAGGVVMPLDPSHPVARLRYMVEDCAAELIVTNVDAEPGLVAGRAVLDLREPGTWTPDPNPPAEDCADDQVVYCLYTSGSTGRPKGVLLKQQGIRNVLEWARGYWKVGEDDGFLQKATFTFDISIVEQFLPLTSGARVILLPPGDERSPDAIHAAIVEHRPSLVQFTPSGLATYLAVVGEDPLPGITRCLAAGEPLKPALRDAFFAAVGGCGLTNLYGPTENTIYATAARVPRVGPITVGAALPNTALYILDEDGRPCADGEVGEVCIGGVGVSHGYLGLPELTQERYVPDPAAPGSRYYRSGDLGVLLPDGELDVRGRRDYQVKIRGFRVELGEIESALAALDGVKDAVVVDVESEASGQRDLVAYWIGEGSARDLAEGLRRSLPGYMVPSRFIRMTAFPLTTSGKVQRAELPSPDEGFETAADYVAPTDALSARLCALYEQVVGPGRVGLGDRFLDLGGDSLKAVRLAMLVRQKLDRVVEVDQLLRNGTVGELAAELAGASGDADGGPQPAPAAPWYPMASGQCGLWLLEQAGADHAAYTEPLIFELEGEVDTRALGGAIADLVRRHESLRTAYDLIDDMPMQRAVPADRVLDFRMERVAGRRELDDALSALVAADFDLTAGRLMRAVYYELNPGRSVLALVLHHIATDGWSLSVLIDELVARYNARRAGGPAAEALVLQYKDYAHWQQERLRSGALDESRRYWTAQLTGTERLELPTDRPHPSRRSYRGHTLRRVLRAETVEPFKALCHAERVTLFAGLCAALRVLFYRYCGQRDFTLGTSSVGRSAPVLEGQLGYYVKALALRGIVRSEATFRSVLQEEQSTLLDALRHDEYPFDQVVADINEFVDSERNPLFDVMVMIDPGWGDPGDSFDGVRMTRCNPPNAHSKMDLTLFFKETVAGLLITAEYSTDVFDRDRIERMLDHFTTLLMAAAAEPRSRVDNLELLPADERRLVLEGFNDTARDYGPATTVTELFEAQARRTPDRVATLDEQAELTFAALDAQANALAWELRDRHGVAEGELVALYMDRGVHMVVSILGVLKAGAAYLPVNRKDPSERVTAVLADSGSGVLLTDDPSAASALATGLSVLDVTAPRAGRPDAPARSVEPDDVAYCIYTSGSTGVPNGVLIEHRSLVNRLRWTTEDLGLSESDVFLQKTPYVFDVSVWELLLPGVLGARQVMLRPGGEGDPAVIRAAIERHGVSVVHFVPSMLERYLSCVRDSFAGVRACVCSGEALGDELVARFHETAATTGTRLHNYYGPTEAAIDVTAIELDPGRAVTIGRPVANTRIYILDEAGRPSPVGVTGELCIAGVQVGRGYRNRPELTAQRFTSDPFRPGERMYRTGDLTRWTPEGTIDYRGRRDGQVKLRGFRIELGEIEQVLCAQDGVDAAVVLLQRDTTGTEYLCAYVAGPVLPETASLRAAVRDRLPEYMAPTYYVRLEGMPVTGNGKADRKALRKLGALRAAQAPEVAGPRTDTERRLLELWRDLLPEGAVGVTDDFFTVGGHSLNALQLSSRISKEFNVVFGLADVFANRTAADQAAALAAAVRARRPDWGGGRAAGDSERLPLSFAQERMWFLHMLEPGSSAYHIRMLARVAGPLDPGVLRESVADLVQRHEILRTTFAADDEGAYQTVHDELPLPFGLHDLRALPADEAGPALREHTRREVSRPFELGAESPLRVVLYRVADDEHYLLVVVQHLAADGWSLRLLAEDLCAFYGSRCGSGDATPAPLSLQYADYARWLRDPVNQAGIEHDLEYWTGRLAGLPTLTLATDEGGAADGGPRDYAAAASLVLEVPEATVRRIHSVAAGTKSTPFEFTMAALNLLLSRLADQQDVVVGFPVANRHDVDLEPLIGLFLNTLALRTDLSGAPRFSSLLRRVSTGVREAYQHQSAPFETLVERLNPERRLDRTPVFEVMLNYQEETAAPARLGSAAVEYRDDELDVQAKYALQFYVLADGDSMKIELVHRRELFSAARARLILDQFGALLAQAAADPEQPITAYRLGEGIGGFDQPLPAPALPPVTELVARQAAARPRQPAIVQGGSVLRYAELAGRVEDLARRLIAAGTEPGDIVAVTGPRGIGFAVALLSVMRAGATVFPLDPQLPAVRTEHLLGIARPVRTVLVGDPPEHGAVCGPCEIVEARTGRSPGPVTETADAKSGLPAVREDVPAYLFFTSGTTGKPRGVLGRHSGLSHFLTWQRDTFGITPDDRCAQTTSVSFDVMLRDTLLALVSGATLVVPEPADESGGRALFDWLERRRVTVLHAVPTVFRSLLLDAAPGITLQALRLLFFAGEPLKASLVETFRASFPDSSRLVNLYGPTETTLAKFAYQVPDGPLPAALPVGRPLPDCQALVMRDMVPCGVGEPGEIVIRTPMRSFGYFKDPAADAASFVPNPFGDDPADLLYRTGDLGRLRPDGLLEVLGRCDHQMKINGVRIEPAEVEHTLLRHPSVSAALVKAVVDERDEKRLVGYVVPANGCSVDRAELHAFLAERLVPAMIPSLFVPLAVIPTTPNGKPDHAALPAPVFTRAGAGAPAEPPADETEHAVAALWAEALDGTAPGRHENFFDLGGTSLRLLRLHGLLTSRLGAAVRVAQLFTHPTVAAQAALFEPARAAATRPVEETDIDF